MCRNRVNEQKKVRHDEIWQERHVRHLDFSNSEHHSLITLSGYATNLLGRNGVNPDWLTSLLALGLLIHLVQSQPILSLRATEEQCDICRDPDD